ncbi:hypothetical protein B5566_09030 [Mycobacterium sp. MHSD3]|jgi:hypothetical protein|nr:hypothetical protein B5566_09030 [Mycobacterium sp. MHSD3]
MSTISIAIAVVSVGLFVLSIAMAWQAQRMRTQQHNKTGTIHSHVTTTQDHVNQRQDRAEKLDAVPLQEDEPLSASPKKRRTCNSPPTRTEDVTGTSVDDVGREVHMGAVVRQKARELWRLPTFRRSPT